MIYATLDMITKRSLLEKGLPIHYYLEFLLHSSACIRELSTDTLKIINTVRCPVNSYFAIDLPNDFVDDLAVCIPVGGLLQPISKKDSINPLRNTSGSSFVSYTDTSNTGAETFYGMNTNWLWFWNVNDYGEPTGRYFGANGGSNMNGYKLVKERRQIQLSETFSSDDVVLMYISDGQSADNATQIDMLAFSTVQSYITWMTSPNAGIVMSKEGLSYYNFRRLLRGRLDDLTICDLKDILRRNYTASLKN